MMSPISERESESTMDEREDHVDEPESDELKLPQDLEPDEQDATEVKGGIGLLLPAVQKVREP